MKGDRDGKGFLGSFMANAMELNKTNGTTDMMGLPSQGAQELAQKVDQNQKTSFMQQTAGVLQNMNPYSNLYPGSPDNPMDPFGNRLVPGPDGNLINEQLMKQTGGDPRELERIKQILQRK